ncbi:MAG: hypothetical protein JWR37_2956 [Mycobacterium sp.]|nr:hypothetical protein [Mycobacterium sp.]
MTDGIEAVYLETHNWVSPPSSSRSWATQSKTWQDQTEVSDKTSLPGWGRLQSPPETTAPGWVRSSLHKTPAWGF